MKKYFIAKGDEQEGPYHLGELSTMGIHPTTLIWSDDFEDWTEAQNITELKDLLKNIPPPLPKKSKNTSLGIGHIYANDEILDDYDYSQVEDIAGVNYRNGIIVVGAFIFLNLFFKSFLITTVGSILATGLAIGAWWFFKQYFDSVEDKDTGKFILFVMGAHLIFGLTYLFVSTTDWVLEGQISIIDLLLGTGLKYAEGVMTGIQVAIYGTFLSMAIIFISGIRIIWVNKKHPFPLKRIAVSAMFLIPLGMISQLAEGITKVVEMGLLGNLILMLPFVFLLHHFYRAEMEDHTP